MFWKERSNEIVNLLIKNSTGKIEIIDVEDKATGDYIFSLDECDYEDFGYDTKLKYKFILDT